MPTGNIFFFINLGTSFILVLNIAHKDKLSHNNGLNNTLVIYILFDLKKVIPKLCSVIMFCLEFCFYLIKLLIKTQFPLTVISLLL